MSKETQISRQISYLLRHNPEDLDIDKEGWVRTNDLMFKLKITLEFLKGIVDNNDKKRFAFNDDMTKIRANQGHSKKLDVKIKYKTIRFPQTYYHGTALMNVDSIMTYGLSPKNRKHVHLSQDIETAKKVASRHSISIVILSIDGAAMSADNSYKLYMSENNVVLVDYVAPKYITMLRNKTK